jgi:DNA-binding transcriptional MocR family regulator
MQTSSLNISLIRDSEEPIYRQLIRQIQVQIDSGILIAGIRLPASRDLAKQLGISRISVVNAYAELRSEGYLSAHAGRGTFVSRDKASSPHHENTHQRPMYQQNDTGQSIRDMMRLARKPGVINFSHGAPPKEFFPVRHMQDAINAVLDRDGAGALSYEVPEGYLPLRVAVRDYVRALGIQCRFEDVLITGGAQQAIDLVVQSLMSEGETLVTADPTYLGIKDIAQARRVRIQGIPVDEDGIRIDALENYLHDHTPRLIYVMPSFQNPTGHVMPMHRRRQLIRLAERYQIPVLEDEVYREFRFDGEHLPPLKALDEKGMVIHANAFTKMLLPGMRIGYLIADGQYYDRLVRVKQAADISTSGLNQRTIHLLLERGILAKQLERNRLELRRRRDVALAAAKEYFPEGATWFTPQGGLYLWVELPADGPTSPELFITGIQMDVAFAIGGMFYTGRGGSHAMRLNYGIHKAEEIREGFHRIGEAWKDLAVHYGSMQKSPML